MEVSVKECSSEFEKLCSIEKLKLLKNHVRRLATNGRYLIHGKGIHQLCLTAEARLTENLNSTERRLANNPEQAEAYDDQMKEMAKLNF